MSSNNPVRNPTPPKKGLSNANVATAPPTLPDPDTSFLELMLEAYRATPTKGIRAIQVRSFLLTRYQLPEATVDQILPFTLEFAVDMQLLVKVSGRQADPMSWSTRLNPMFILILLRRLREDAKTMLAVAAGRGQTKRKADDGEDQTSRGGSGGKMARL